MRTIDEEEREGGGTREREKKIWSGDICYAAAEFKRRGERECRFHVKMSMMIIGDDLMRRLRLVPFFESVRYDRISTGSTRSTKFKMLRNLEFF